MESQSLVLVVEENNMEQPIICLFQSSFTLNQSLTRYMHNCHCLGQELLGREAVVYARHCKQHKRKASIGTPAYAKLNG